MPWEASREILTGKWHDQIPILKYHSGCYIKYGVLGLNAGRFLEAGRPKVAMDLVQGDLSGPGQAGSVGGGGHLFESVAVIPEEQYILKGETWCTERDSLPVWIDPESQSGAGGSCINSSFYRPSCSFFQEWTAGLRGWPSGVPAGTRWTQCSLRTLFSH